MLILVGIKFVREHFPLVPFRRALGYLQHP